MHLKNCENCGKLFFHHMNFLCSDCKKVEDGSLQRLVDYLKENKDASLVEVATRTGLSIKEITKYMREGRLASLGIHAAIRIYCEKCNAPIASGRFCNECNYKLKKEIEGVTIKEEEPKDFFPKRESKKVKMYTINAIRGRKKRNR